MRKLRIRFQKLGRAAFISHLDTMRTLQRAIARAGIEAKHTEGFNPHAYVSIALPLSLGYTSDCEFLDLVLMDEMSDDEVVERLNRALPEGMVVVSAQTSVIKVKEIESAAFRITMEYDAGVPAGASERIAAVFAQCPFMILKKSKRGETESDISGLIREINLTEEKHRILGYARLAAGNSSLNPDYLTRSIRRYAPDLTPDFVSYHRLAVFCADGKEFQ